MVSDDSILSILNLKGNRIWDVAPHTPVYDALQLMADQDIGALLVMSGTELRGVFTERDYARKIVLEGKSSKYTRVTDVMSPVTVMASPWQTGDHCLRLMHKHGLRYLPIVEYGTVIGIISIGDLVNWTMQRQREEIEHLNRFIVNAAAVTSGS